MAKRIKTHFRLPGRSGALIALTRLWRTSDHLLMVTLTVATESYKRFYYRDIQAIVIRKTSVRKYLNLAFGGAAFLCLLAAGLFLGLASWQPVLTSASQVFAMIFAIIGAVLLALLVFNSLRGETCVTELQTAVQVVRLPSLSRVRVAERVLAQLKPIIESAATVITPSPLD